MPLSEFEEAQIQLALQDIRSCRITSVRQAVKVYKVSKTTLLRRMANIPSRIDCHPNSSNLSESEEEVLCIYLLDKDDRGYGLKLAAVEEIANYVLDSRGGTTHRY